MSVRRTSRRRSPVRHTKVAARTTSLKVGKNASGDRLVEAANKLADGIRDVSSEFSRKIPASVDVRPAGDDLVFVVATAPNADPIENGKKHPLFGKWVNKPQMWMRKRPFMEQGVAKSIDDAADIYGQTVDDWLHEIGWS